MIIACRRYRDIAAHRHTSDAHIGLDVEIPGRPVDDGRHLFGRRGKNGPEMTTQIAADALLHLVGALVSPFAVPRHIPAQRQEAARSKFGKLGHDILFRPAEGMEPDGQGSSFDAGRLDPDERDIP